MVCVVSVLTCSQAGFRNGASGDYEFSFKMGFDFGFKQGLQYGLHRGGIKGTTMWVYCCMITCYSVHAWYVLYEPVFMWNVPGMVYHMIMARCGVDH